MNWEKLLSAKRYGPSFHSDRPEYRAEFQRDYDRLIFSAPFRRLQNKTQVFPLPGSVFVHNRLTHSLEVSSVGRSLSTIVSRELVKRHPNCQALNEIDSIVAAGCLAHDMGNPPFGHSGESAIALFFQDGNGKQYKDIIGDRWSDFCYFEGNANTFRLLSHQFKGKRQGGFCLTYSTLASIVKYPYESKAIKNGKNKFGFFQPEKVSYLEIAEELGIIKDPNDNDKFVRHPLVYLVEAADDICYQIMDIEDAHKLKILTDEETKELLLQYFSGEALEHKKKILEKVEDVNEQISYLRSVVIGLLVNACTQTFIDNEESILNGTFKGSLIDNTDENIRNCYKACSKLSVKKIYRSTEVLDIEVAGYKIILTLLDELTKAVLNPDKPFSHTLLSRIPEQYDIHAEKDVDKIMAIVDYVSGMTDVFALDLYQKITGMSLHSL